ncbi:MAG TPA: tetraacyldisaccharide 4'-kinase [Gallionella sp.]|nr:tetraacyldisaccharide 4'-kinase [Gallionella sp.]
MHWLEHHWYRITPLHLILFPVSLLFRALVALRRALYRSRILSSHKLPVPVIVVGNISAGGTGKTPLTLALAQQLADRGWHPLIVSRGYGGAAQQPRHVGANSDAQQVGDEPLLMARRNLCPVWIGKDRAAAAQAALQANPQCDVALCDDGLQHYRLQRDVEVAVVDGERGFGNGFMLPAGPLREPVSRLRTVDAVVVNGGKTSPDQYAMRLSGGIFYNLLDPEKTATASHFHMLNNHAVAGIGHPQRYFRHLQTLGISFTPHAFPDHHPYSAADLAFAGCDAILLTEKDAVKCAAFADARSWVLRVDAQIDPALVGYILRKIESHGHKTA